MIMVRRVIRQQIELGSFLFQWRQRNTLSMREAAERIGVSSSTLSDLEKGKRRADIETLFGIAEAMDLPLQEIAAKAGYESKRSRNAHDRAERMTSVIDAMPQMGAIADALPTFSPDELDTVLTVIELVISRRQKR